jgi:hypothetical protein
VISNVHQVLIQSKVRQSDGPIESVEFTPIQYNSAEPFSFVGRRSAGRFFIFFGRLFTHVQAEEGGRKAALDSCLGDIPSFSLVRASRVLSCQLKLLTGEEGTRTRDMV